MADTVPLETHRLLQLSYDKIIALDEKLQALLSSMPYFFKLDAQSSRKRKALEAMHPTIPIARYCIITDVHSRRCKFHQRFLLRQSTNPHYAYSRQACLESARAVVQVYTDLRGNNEPATPPELMGMAVHFTHLAVVVMAMDLCFNRDAADQPEVKADFEKALKMFEDADNASPLLERFLGSLKEVLRKHDIQLTNPATLGADPVVGYAQGSTRGAFNGGDEDGEWRAAHLNLNTQEPGFALDTSFDDFWLAVQGESNPDFISWDNMFSAIDSRPL